VTWFSLWQVREAVKHAKAEEARKFPLYEAAYMAQEAEEDARFEQAFPFRVNRGDEQ
jgi:hypothetical protein